MTRTCVSVCNTWWCAACPPAWLEVASCSLHRCRNDKMIADTLVLGTPQEAASAMPFTHGERTRYLMHYGGHAMAFSTMQPDLEYFDTPGIGYIAFARCMGMTIALSDPICDAQH